MHISCLQSQEQAFEKLATISKMRQSCALVKIKPNARLSVRLHLHKAYKYMTTAKPSGRKKHDLRLWKYISNTDNHKQITAVTSEVPSTDIKEQNQMLKERFQIHYVIINWCTI